MDLTFFYSSLHSFTDLVFFSSMCVFGIYFETKVAVGS